MKLKLVVLTVALMAAVTGFSSVASAQSSGNSGLPRNARECKLEMKSLVGAFAYHEKIYKRDHKVLDKERKRLLKQQAPLTARQAVIQARMTEIEALLNDPAITPEAADALNSEWNDQLNPEYSDNALTLHQIELDLDGLKADFAGVEKKYKAVIKDLTKYRSKVVKHCKKF